MLLKPVHHLASAALEIFAPTSVCRRLALAVTAVFLSVVAAPATTTIISDSTFAVSDWSLQIGSNSEPGVTAGDNQVLSGGNPGSYLAVNYVPLGPGNLNMMTYFTGQSYSPMTQGPISSISFSADLINLTGANIVFFGVFQDNQAYYLIPPPFLILNSSWASYFGSGAIGNDFYSANDFTRPNLLNGDPIEFGIVTSVTGGIVPGSYGIDNFQVTITSTPEPKAWVLAALGTLACALYSSRRRFLVS